MNLNICSLRGAASHYILKKGSDKEIHSARKPRIRKNHSGVKREKYERMLFAFEKGKERRFCLVLELKYHSKR